MIKEIDTAKIKDAVKRLSIEANKVLPADLCARINLCGKCEKNPLAKNILSDLQANLDAAVELDVPICQDTGMAVVFLEIGQDVHLTGQLLTDAVNQGVAEGYTEGLLRKSVVDDPIKRVNTDDNTPAVIHTSIVAGNEVKLTVAPKGFGSENMSRIYMLTPAATEEKIIECVVDAVKNAGGNPCPPLVVGVGIGGDFELSALLAKKALCRGVSERHPEEYYRELEEKMLIAINETGVGPQGFGGDTTALAVNIEKYATHIAGLPLAVNIGCHVTRHKTEIIK